jgi:NADH-quinone oxidoreductase subunit D
MLGPDRSQYPVITDGKADIDLSSQKYLKIWQGPQHPGVTGNMALELTVAGDEIADARTHVGYLHRGFEKLMERRRYIQCFPLVCRMCVPEPDYPEYVFAQGVENLAGLTAPPLAQWLRTLVLEMARINGMLASLAGQAGTLGLGIIGQWNFYVRDLMLDRFEELTGGRVYHMYILPGGVRGRLPEGFGKRMEETLREIETVLDDGEKAMFNNAVFKKRTVGVGIIPPEMIEAYGVVGTNARAAGFARDVRRDYPYGVYDRLDFEVITGTDSDIYTRTVIRQKELIQSLDLIRQILDRMPRDGEYKTGPVNVLNWKIPAGETYVRSESSRGEFGMYLVSDGTEYPRRASLRGPSYTHGVALLERLLPGQNISDVSNLMVSLQTCPPEIER